jgi:glycosyltransferase involved in cell wall biosynthesis
VVEVLVGGDGPYAELLRKAGLKVINLRYLVRPIRPHLDIMAVLEVKQALRRFRPNIVHAHSAKAGLVGRVAAWLEGLPVVFTAHGWAFTEGIAERSRRLALFLEKRAVTLSDGIICVSEYDRQLALSLGVGSASLLSCIHNGVPEVAANLQNCDYANKVLRVISVARLDAQKDHILLLEALHELKNMKWELELIGDGPLTEAVQRHLDALGLSDRVIFSGLCNDVPARLACADIFVLVSNWEGLPLSILEAMRASLPVVASDVGGVAESVTDGVTGFLVPRGDKASLTQRLESLLLDAGLRQQMGRAGRFRYENEFSFGVMYERTHQLYRDVLAQKCEG